MVYPHCIGESCESIAGVNPRQTAVQRVSSAGVRLKRSCIVRTYRHFHEGGPAT